MHYFRYFDVYEYVADKFGSSHAQVSRVSCTQPTNQTPDLIARATPTSETKEMGGVMCSITLEHTVSKKRSYMGERDYKVSNAYNLKYLREEFFIL